MNYLWAGMMLAGIVYGALTGNMQAVTDGALEAAGDAVNLCIAMTGILSLWTGVMEVAKNAGLIKRLSEKIQPFVHFLFPKIPRGHAAEVHITTNIIANVLGLGWAATPAGLKAMEALSDLEEDRRNGRLPGKACRKGVASNEMCTFLILNISSLQLVPVNVIAYRAQYGSVNPTAIVGPGIAATAVSTAVAVVFCKVMDKKRRV